MNLFTMRFKGVTLKIEKTSKSGNRGICELGNRVSVHPANWENGENSNLLKQSSPILSFSDFSVQKISQNFIIRNMFALLIFLLLIANCGGSKPARFYILTPVLEKGSNLSSTVETRDISIGIGPVVFPDYLMRPQIATYLNPNEIHYAEFDRWAESLPDNFIQIMAENLSKLIPTDQIAIFPWRATTPVQYQVTIQVISFELQTENRVILKVRWSTFEHENMELLKRKISSFSLPYQSSNNKMDYANLVAIMSRLVEKLSQEIAVEIKSVSN